MHTARQVIAILPSFTEAMENKQRWELWDAMDAAYRAGLADAAERLEKTMKSGIDFINMLSVAE